MASAITKAKLGGGVAAGVALAIGIIAPWEGKRNDPYYDIVRVRTVCYGETRVPMRRYSDAECLAMLHKAVERDFAPQVFRCVPGLATRPHQAGPAISLAYNIGTARFCASTAARLMNAGRWREGCQAMGRYILAGGKPLQGLINRRKAEVSVCLQGLA